jgi:hypothetical protein
MLLAFLLSFLVVPSVVASAKPRDGSIRGTVLTADGKPVPDAHVYAEVMRGSKILTVLNTNTDDLGIFMFSRLAAGKYRVAAEKGEAGYLSTWPDIFTARPALTLVITPDRPTVTTLIRFGPRAGVITGWVRDSATGRRIGAHLSLAPISPGGGWSTTGTDGRFKFRLFIPANTAIRFGACAEGYQPWLYDNPLQLRPGTKLELDIKLERSLENAQTPCWYGTF